VICVCKYVGGLFKCRIRWYFRGLILDIRRDRLAVSRISPPQTLGRVIRASMAGRDAEAGIEAFTLSVVQLHLEL
jgi:hypothetical protein